MRSHFNCRLIAAALMLIGTNAFATPVTISFEEIGKIVGGSGTLAHPGVINGVDFGALAAGASTGQQSIGDPFEGGCGGCELTVKITQGSVTSSVDYDEALGDVDTVTSTVLTAEVPEPAAWALMLVGFAGLGFALRSARKNALTA